MPSTLFEELGGEPVLRGIIDRFVDRVFDDVMIGFFFRNARRERIKEKEYEFAARHLGADIAYTGRPLEEAHRAHPIMGGQFARRLMILKETLEAAGVPEHVKQHWLRHTEALRPLVTTDASRECDPERARQRAETAPGGPGEES
jgi:hemoglobin